MFTKSLAREDHGGSGQTWGGYTRACSGHLGGVIAKDGTRGRFASWKEGIYPATNLQRPTCFHYVVHVQFSGRANMKKLRGAKHVPATYADCNKCDNQDWETYNADQKKNYTKPRNSTPATTKQAFSQLEPRQPATAPPSNPSNPSSLMFSMALVAKSTGCWPTYPSFLGKSCTEIRVPFACFFGASCKQETKNLSQMSGSFKNRYNYPK